MSAILQTFFVAATSSILLASSVPALRSRYVAYGSRATPISNTPQDASKKSPSDGLLDKLLDFIATLQVPHGYFVHFYIVSIVSSIFWGYQIFTRGLILMAISPRPVSTGLKGSMSLHQVILTWALMSIHGGRRLWESITLAKPSASKMWFVHWLVGNAFYLGMGMAVWIEGAGQYPSKGTQIRCIVLEAISFFPGLSCTSFTLIE